MPERDLKELLAALPEDQLREFLAASLSSYKSTKPYPFDFSSAGTELLTRYNAFLVKNTFAKGQLVRWKKGLKNRKRPLPGEPAIVLDVLDSPLYDESENTAGSTYFREPLDLLLGILGEEGDFISFYFDSRRFEPMETQKDT